VKDLLVRVERADALTYSTDLLVLKYAQVLYGLDKRVAETMGMAGIDLPPDGDHTLLKPAGIGPRAVLFIGVPPLSEFSYPQIRRFAHRGLSAAASAYPHATELCLTLHGVGYGLDETEAFAAELAGIADAVADGSFPPDLRVVTFLETDPGRADRLRAALKTAVPWSRLPTGPVEPRLERLRSVDAESKDHAFVAMPFDESFGDVFHYAITPAIRQAGLLCERVDELSFIGDVVSLVKQRIGAARFVVADLSGSNPNVYLEVGYAWGLGIPTVLVCDRSTELKFDVQGERCLFYDSIRDLERKLTDEVNRLRR
jgi:hypothetical protein